MFRQECPETLSKSKMNSRVHKIYFFASLFTLTLILKGFLCERICAEEVEPEDTYTYVKPTPLTQKHIIDEILSGTGGGLVLGLTGGYLGFLKDETEPKGCKYFPKYTVYGAVISYTIGSSIGVFFWGNRGDERGSFPATLTGAILGPIIGYGIGTLLQKFLRLSSIYPSGIGFNAGPPIGATIGFNLTRKKRIPLETNDALFNFQDGKLAFSLPQINLTHSKVNSMNLTEKIDLVRISF